MQGARLLETIRAINSMSENGHGVYYTFNLSDELTSISSYLNKILTTKQGSVEIAQDFGIPDYTTIIYESIENAVEIISELLTSVIEKYEPRLKNVSIKFQGKNDNDLSLSFAVEALIINHTSSHVFFRTIFSSDGSISVRES
ncbi:MAG: hypothetical protein RL154_987 [Pseudomonadota bacterium]|jgi:type VI secretion system protein